ncbi:phosphoenolpyruvate--protein phosphotransferase [Leucobacter sp. HY1908]
MASHRDWHRIVIGIVVVSHSASLAAAAVELALQMVPAGGTLMQVAAGAGVDGAGLPVLGTDAMAVADAIDALAQDPGCTGIVVLMDLGSAVLSAELALELRASDTPAMLVGAPFIEGLLTATVSAASGASLDEVAHEAAHALTAKAAQLGEAPPQAETPARAGALTQADSAPTGDLTLGAGDDPDHTPAAHTTVTVRNALGIHARPAALIAEASRAARVTLRKLPGGVAVGAASLTRLLTLGARQGDEIELTATGSEAAATLAALERLFDEGFGEGVEAAAPQTLAPQPQPVSQQTPGALPEQSASPEDGTLQGRGVSGGAAAAQVVQLQAVTREPSATPIAPDERAGEARALAAAARQAGEDLGTLADAAEGPARAILEAARLIATDPDLLQDATARINGSAVTAARAIWEAAALTAQQLRAQGDRAGERVTDLYDARDRIIAHLTGQPGTRLPTQSSPYVLAATDLAPADAHALAGSGCVALVTEQGGPTSHTAIIARSLGLPAVTNVAGATLIAEGVTVLVDGDTGVIELHPTAERLARLKETAGSEASKAAPEFSGVARLASGETVPLLANVGGGAEAEQAASAHANGVGLFRTEFCFLQRDTAPTVDEQVAEYLRVLTPFAGSVDGSDAGRDAGLVAGNKVVVRTLDSGSDKPLPFASLSHEDNPALGIRGLRTSWQQPDLLDDQLRALALAAAQAQAEVWVMAPMIATLEEAAEFVQRARAAGLARAGVMVETPAAAVMARELCEVVDFVSIGTNDLAQYTMAADRLSPALGHLNDPWQPAVLRLIGQIGAAGQGAGKPVGVCGEAAGDALLAPVLLGLGVTSLSMTPRALGTVERSLAQYSRDDCERMAEAALGARTVAEVREVVAAWSAGGVIE